MKKLILLITILKLTLSLYSQNNIVAVVNGENITYNEVKNKMSINFFYQALNEIISEKLIIQEAKKRKIDVSKNEVEEMLKTIKNRFNSEKDFKKDLKRLGVSEEEYYNMIKTNLLVEKTVKEILQIKVTEEDAKRYYDSNPQEFTIPQAIRLRQIYVLTEEKAKDIYDALEAGADFQKLSILKSEDERLKQNAGDIGFITKGMLLPEIEKEVFQLAEGKYTKPIKTGNGYSIFRLEEKREESKIKFEDVKDRIIQNILSNQITQGKIQLLNQLKNQSKKELK